MGKTGAVNAIEEPGLPARGCLVGLVLAGLLYGVGYLAWRLVQWVMR